MTNMTTRASHCVVSTSVKPSCAYQSQSAYRFAKTKNATTSAAMMASVIAMMRRERFGAADWGADVVVTHPS